MKKAKNLQITIEFTISLYILKQKIYNIYREREKKIEFAVIIINIIESSIELNNLN
jgi:hypothetical protein